MEQQFGRKRAKESARYFKLYNSQIQSDISFNLRSFANFLNLRMSEFAQVEIREIAESMLELVRQTGKFEHTLKAWGY
jgi:thymidylate synthase ThyX